MEFWGLLPALFIMIIIIKDIFYVNNLYQQFVLMIRVPGISGSLVVKIKLSPFSGSLALRQLKGAKLFKRFRFL